MLHPTPYIFTPSSGGTDKNAIAADWRKPRNWHRQAVKSGQRAKVFCYDPLERIPTKPRKRLWGVIADTTNLDWLLVTADPELFELGLPRWPPKNVWLGVSVHGDDAPTLLDLLRRQKAAVKFVWVFKPIKNGDLDLTGIDWVLIDGQPDNEALEQGWARALIDAAKNAGAQIWFPFAQDATEAQIAEILQFGLPTLDEMHEQMEAAIEREADRLAAVEAVEAADILPTALPVALPLALPAPDAPPPREEPTTTATLPLVSNVFSLSDGPPLDADGDGDLPYGFFRDHDGLYYLRPKPNPDGDEDQDEPRFICGGSFDVIANVLDGSGHYSHLVEFIDLRNNKVRWQFFVDTGATAILKMLKRKGLQLARIEQDRLMLIDFIGKRKVTRRITTVSRRWHGSCYVMGKGAIGPTAAGEELVLADSFSDTQTYCGTLEGWQKTIGEACIGNQILTFSLSVAFSAFVLEPLNAECMGFMLYCDSSMGKGSTVSAACSVAGTKLSDCIDTPYNIETHATRNSDTLIVFDELDEAKNPAEFSRNIYLLGNGRGKGRSTKEKSTWRLPWMVTGETSMSKVRADAKMKPLTRGETVRLIEIFADAGKGLGTFDTVHEAKDAQHFADALQACAKQNQGVAAEAFLIRLTADLPYAIKKLNETRESFIADEKTKLGLTNPPPDLIRAMDHFAVTAASGELATEFDTVPWQPGDASRALSATFELWFTTEYKVIEDPQIGMRQALKWIAANMDRFERGPEKNGHIDHYITLEAFRNEACAGLDYMQVARQLRTAGILIHSPGGLTYQRRDPNRGVHIDVYRVRLPVGYVGYAGDTPRASKAVN